jgi:hypothetical protein
MKHTRPKKKLTLDTDTIRHLRVLERRALDRVQGGSEDASGIDPGNSNRCTNVTLCG